MKTVRFDYCKGETARAYTVSGLHDGEDLSGDYVLASEARELEQLVAKVREELGLNGVTHTAIVAAIRELKCLGI